MDLKKKIENNPIIIIISACVTTAIITFGIVQYFNSQKIDFLTMSYENNINKFESILSSIERDVPGQEYLDIRNLLMWGERNKTIPNNLEYFSNDNFYAIQNDDYWNYFKMSEFEFVAMLYQENIDSLFTDSAQQVSLKNGLIHIWSSEKINTEDNNIQNIPFITLQKIDFSHFGNMIGQSINSEYTRKMYDLEDSCITEFNFEEFTDLLDKYMKTDAPYFIFMAQNNMLMDLFGSQENISIKANKIQKVGNVLYSQHQIKIEELNQQGLLCSHYIHRETIIVSNFDCLYMISISIPSEEPIIRDAVNSHVNDWISNLKINLQ
jgi:hypothetical protein